MIIYGVNVDEQTGLGWHVFDSVFLTCIWLWLFANSFMIILYCLIAWFIDVLMICFPVTFVIADKYFNFGSLSYICIWFVWLLQVETIGDAYCVAAGLHRKSLCHAKPIALMALKMMELSEEVLTPDGRPIQVSLSIVLFE